MNQPPRFGLAKRRPGTTAAATAYTMTAQKVDRPAAWMMAPYLGWLGFAGDLNGAIVARNPRLA